MSRPEEGMRTQVDQEGSVSSAFGKMGELYVPMQIIVEGRDGTGRRGGFLADGKD